MTKLIATTAVGLEEIAAQDLRDSFGLPALAARNGAVSVSLPGPAPRPEVIDAIKTLSRASPSGPCARGTIPLPQSTSDGPLARR